MSLSKLRFSPVSLFIVCLLIIAFSGCGTTLPTASSLRQPELRVGEGLGENYIDFSDSLILGRVTHTDSLLQVQLLIPEGPMVMRLLMNGVTIWVDSTARTNQTLGVVFPGAGPALRQWAPGADRFQPRHRDNDTVFKFDPTPVLEVVRQRNMVFRFGERAEFIENNMGRVFLDDQQNLNYVVIIPFEKLGVSDPGNARVSIGVISEVPTFQAPEQQQQPQQPMPGGRTGRPGYPDRRYDPGMQRQPMQPIEKWIIFTFDQTPQETPLN